MNIFHCFLTLFLLSFFACQDVEKKLDSETTTQAPLAVERTKNPQTGVTEKKINFPQTQKSIEQNNALLKEIESKNSKETPQLSKEIAITEKKENVEPKKIKSNPKNLNKPVVKKPTANKEDSEEFVKVMTPDGNEDFDNKEHDNISPGSNTHPDIQFSSLTYDFGEIDEGDKIDYNFNFVNTGRRPLEVIRATAPCGCTVPSYPFIAINPGETGYIGVQYNSVGKDGPQKPEIDVFTSLRKAPFRLYLEGNVIGKEKIEVLSDSPFVTDTIKGN